MLVIVFAMLLLLLLERGNLLFWLALCYLVVCSAHAADTIPRECLQYRQPLVRNARAIWGPDAPVATLAAQVRQESGCRASARSAYASGLTQFTPATATWISRLYPDLVSNTPLNPVWAMRAQDHYMLRLYQAAGGATACDRMWFALWDYNGGVRWRQRDQALAAAHGVDPTRHEAVEPFNGGRAPAMFRENRGYPMAIIRRWQPLFVAAGWGNGVCE